MSDTNAMLNDAEWLARQFRQRDVDLSEAQKAGAYYISKKCNDAAMARYLELMATNPPPRSQRSRSHFRNLWDIWRTWQTGLTGKDKAQAWGWGVRLARSPERPGPAPRERRPARKPERVHEPTPVSAGEAPRRIQDLAVGMVLTGTVRRIMPYGAFVDIGVGRDGLVHISELSEGFVRSVEDVVSVGQEVTVRIKEVDTRRGRIGLSMKGVEQRA
jgi:hypothetical protein